MSDETRLLAEARRLVAEHNYHHDEALMSTIRRAQAAEVKFGVLYADYERLTAKVEAAESRAHAAEQSLGEADAEIERLKAIVARFEALAEVFLARARSAEVDARRAPSAGEGHAWDGNADAWREASDEVASLAALETP